MSYDSFALRRPLRKNEEDLNPCRVKAICSKSFWDSVAADRASCLENCRQLRDGLFAYSSGLHLGPGFRVLGGRHISFGRNVYANRNLWLEAVTSYRSSISSRQSLLAIR